MAGMLENSGYEVEHNKNHANINVVNICTVKGDTTALREIRRLKRQFPEKKLIVAGPGTGKTALFQKAINHVKGSKGDFLAFFGHSDGGTD